MAREEDDVHPLLPSFATTLPAEAGPSSRPHSRNPSRASSAAGSRRPSYTPPVSSKARMSDELPLPNRSGQSSRRSSNADDIVIFKTPGDDEDHEQDHPHSASEPLLSSGGGQRHDRGTAEEIEELLLAEGPNSAARGTLAESIANMANSIIGAGIIGLPYAVAQAGFVTGVTLLVVLAMVTDWTIRLVVVNAKLSGRDSYTDVMHHCFGHAGAGLVSFFQFAFAFGGMCAFNVIIGDSIPPVISYLFPSLAEHAVVRLLVDRRAVIILITLAVSFPLSLHRDIVKLSKSSSFALVSMAIIVFSVLLRGAAVDPSLRGSPLHAFSIIRPGIFSAIGVISFAFVCHHNTMFIYQSIHTPTLDRFSTVTHVSTGMSLIACLLMAVPGYLVFTNKTQGNILNNFSKDDFIINIARFCFGANMSTTLPLENYVCREVVEDLFFKDRSFSYARHVILTSLIVFTSMTVSLLTCDLGVVLEIAGGMSATALAFIFPASAYMVLINGPWYFRQKLPAAACAAFGTIVLLLSCGMTVVKAIRGEGSEKVCT